MIRNREKLKKYSKIINGLINIIKIFPRSFREKIFVFIRNWDSKIGIFLRFILLKTLLYRCGDNVTIFSNVFLYNMNKLSIGDNVSIHPFCYIEAFGEVEIGSDVSIAHGTTIVSTTHNFSSLNIPIKDQGISCKKVKISNNVWIGAKSTILKGVNINEGCIIGANSVVTKNIEKNMIVAGNPVRIIKERE